MKHYNENVLMSFAEKLLDRFDLEEILEQADLTPAEALAIIMQSGYLVSNQDPWHNLLEEAESDNGRLSR